MPAPDPRVHCPRCRKRFRVDLETLRHRGRVAPARCRACGARFKVQAAGEGGARVLAAASGDDEEPGPSRPAPAPPPARKPLAPPPFLPIGERVGRYEVEARIARGGMGAVYRAFDPGANRHVALKVLPADASEDDRRHFEREVQVQGNIRHPQIMPIFDSGFLGRSRYFTMALLSDPLRLGELAALVRTGEAQRDPRLRTLDSLEAVVERVLLPVCQAVHHANVQEGVLHRDLKPDNVLVDRADLRPYVIDFGICNLLGAPNPRLAHLASNTAQRLGPRKVRVTGTLTCMPPEQARGEADPRGDVWALGALLHFLVTGAPPLAPASSRPVSPMEREEGIRLLRDRARQRGDAAEVLELTRALLEVGRRDERSLSDLQRDVLAGTYLPRPRWVPRALEAVIRKAMAPDPEGRYPDARALHDDLRAWLARRPVRALAERMGPPANLLYRTRLYLGRHRWVAALLLVALAVGGALALRLAGTASAPAEAHACLDRAREALDRGAWEEARDALEEARRLAPAWRAPLALVPRIQEERRTRLLAAARDLEDGARDAFGAGRSEEAARRLRALRGLLETELLPARDATAPPELRREVERLLRFAQGDRPLRVVLPEGPADPARQAGLVLVLVPLERPGGRIRWEHANEATPQDPDLSLGPGAWLVGCRRGAGEVWLALKVEGGVEPLRVVLPVDPGAVPHGMVYVEGGRARGPEGEEEVPALFWDREEVTVERYSRFLASLPEDERLARLPRRAGPFTGEEVPLWPEGEGGRIRVPPAGRERHPVEGVSVYDARAFASFEGKRLPTAAEWWWAACGPDGRTSPVGDPGLLGGEAVRLDRMGEGSLPVADRPQDRSPFGLFDMAGNVTEMTGTKTTWRGRHGWLVLGGGYGTGPGRALVGEGEAVAGWVPLAGTGFRCVRAVD